MKHDTREAEDVLDVAVAIAEADGEIRSYYHRDWFDFDAMKDNVTDKNELR
ncbi:hypothetical protein ECT23400_2044, partial [Escherichia coli T234_00]